MMKKLIQKDFQEIRNWIYRNARPLDFAIWQYTFENGSKDAIIEILSQYQNNDGGFGNSIDPDNWNVNSSPYNTQFAIKLLRQINFLDMNHPIFQGIFRYLENTEHKEEYGWIFTIPSNNDYPHAVWWDYNPEDNKFQSIGTTASLCGFILRYGNKNSTLYETATKYTQLLIDRLKSDIQLGDMGAGGYCELLEDMEGADLMDQFDYFYLRDKISQIVREKIRNEKDNFMANPLEFVLSPNSRYYEDNRAEVELALDHIIDERPSMGVWDIPWEWYNGNKYPKAFAITENWWKAAKAIEKLLQLKTFTH
jgi:hypothetical protein